MAQNLLLSRTAHPRVTLNGNAFDHDASFTLMLTLDGYDITPYVESFVESFTDDKVSLSDRRATIVLKPGTAWERDPFLRSFVRGDQLRRLSFTSDRVPRSYWVQVDKALHEGDRVRIFLSGEPVRNRFQAQSGQLP